MIQGELDLYLTQRLVAGKAEGERLGLQSHATDYKTTAEK
jgi:hypothetical protein